LLKETNLKKEDMADILDPEENLFNTIDDNYNDEEDDGDLGFDEDSFTNEDFEEEQEEEEENDDSLFNEEEEEENDDEENFSANELDSFNKKLGTDFKSVEDLKASFQSKETESDEAKEEADYQVLTNKVTLYEKYIGMDNENLVRNQLLSQATAQKKDINDPEVADEIEERLEGLKDLDQLDSMAETLRSNLQSQKERTQNSVDVIDNKRVEVSNASARKNIDDLQNAFTGIFDAKEFLGITVTKEDVLEVYEDIRSNKFFEGVNNNQEMIAKFAMFVKYEKEISKLTNAPTHSDRTKTAFDFLSQNGKRTPRSITSAKGSASSGNPDENTMNFVK
jgi:hypothetical protein